MSYQVSPAPSPMSLRWKDVEMLASAGELSSTFVMLWVCVWSDPFLSLKHILVSIGDKWSQRNLAGGSSLELPFDTF